jgi:hypothetical protein
LFLFFLFTFAHLEEDASVTIGRVRISDGVECLGVIKQVPTEIWHQILSYMPTSRVAEICVVPGYVSNVASMGVSLFLEPVERYWDASRVSVPYGSRVLRAILYLWYMWTTKYWDGIHSGLRDCLFPSEMKTTQARYGDCAVVVDPTIIIIVIQKRVRRWILNVQLGNLDPREFVLESRWYSDTFDHNAPILEVYLDGLSVRSDETGAQSAWKLGRFSGYREGVALNRQNNHRERKIRAREAERQRGKGGPRE